MEQTKDYSLLRQFDLEAAKSWEKICWPVQGVSIAFIGISSDNNPVIEYVNGCVVQKVKAADLRMAPLAWVEGKPVYKSDVLYANYGNKVVKAKDGIDGWILSENGITFKADNCTWNSPKVKREGWINIYPYGNVYMRPTKADADIRSQPDRIACVRIEWEE